MMEKTFDAAAVEGRVSALWEQTGTFRAGRPDRAAAEPFCVVIPPPNVTGNLHMGHALNNTLQDILCRYWRMNGRDVLWQPGVDHAGIATQMVVERLLMERQEPDRRTLGREKFLERVWAWKAESGGAIVAQLKRLGASCDWSRERFTLDQGLSRAVAKVFVQLYREGLVYRDKRLVNWDPRFQTAISDLEVVQVECKGSFRWSRDDGAPLDAAALAKVLAKNPNGHLYYLDYPVLNPRGQNLGERITVATTRPETMLGDMAVAVHPVDERYKHLIGRYILLPLRNRPLPIIADEYSDPEKGTGAVKITPAHDFNDFDVWKRYVARMDPGEKDWFEETYFRDPSELIEIFTPSATLKSRASDDLRFQRVVGAPWPPPPSYLRKFTSNVEPNITDEALRGGLSDSSLIPETLRGLDRYKARIEVIRLLAENGLVAKIEPHVHAVPHGDRSGEAIEPFLTDQWYVDAKTLAGPAIAAVRDGRTMFVPSNWEKTYFEWLENIQPWCISRQIWWGHRIPVWYGPDGAAFAAVSLEEAKAAAARYYEQNGHRGFFLRDEDDPAVEGAKLAAAIRDGSYDLDKNRDPDVLDTWFSSALWPFSTLGWPDETPELNRFYPTDALVTGFDIIFFWVARMMMMGLHFMKDIPFRDVYIHALVRDERGAKMSKSKGNVIDPIALIDRFGADALRFTLAAMAAQGRDIKLSEARVEGYRNFATKLWNASRFAEMNGCVRVEGFDPAQTREPLNRWILGEAATAAAETAGAIESYRFNDAASAVYRFVWSVFCDWHLELAKPLLQGGGVVGAKAETQATIAHVLDSIYALLHPFMPFLTEELWAIKGEAGPRRAGQLALGPWPKEGLEIDEAVEAEIGWVVNLIADIRSVKSEMGVPPSTLMPLILVAPSERTARSAGAWSESIKRLARVSAIETASAPPAGVLQLVVRGEVVALRLAGIVDLAVERARLDKEIAKERVEIAKVEVKLGNADFVAHAPEDVIAEHEERLEAFQQRLVKLTAARARLERV